MQGNLFNKVRQFLKHQTRDEGRIAVEENAIGPSDHGAESSDGKTEMQELQTTEFKTEVQELETTEVKTDSETTVHSVEEIKQEVVKVLKTCYDPEIPVDVFELGLIYDIKVATNGDVLIVMTLTSPACPVAGSLPLEIEQKVREHPIVNDCKVEITFDPPWNQRMMSEVAMLELGFL